MRTFSIAEAKARFSEIINEAANGETVEITRRGKVVARVIGSKPATERFDVEDIWNRTRQMPMQKESAGDFVRRMRDSDRY